MRPFLALAAAGLIAPAGSAHATAADTYSLPADVRQLVTSPAQLRAFARPLAAEVERLLAATPAAEGKTLDRLLALRVHLALLTRDAPRALDSAARSRERQTGAIEQAYAGLTTEATVAAWRANEATAVDFAATFRREFAHVLKILPRSADARRLLERQRDRIRGLTREALLAEAEQLGARLDATGRCSLAEADTIIRIGHRLENIVPLRETMLAVFEAEIAARATDF